MYKTRQKRLENKDYNLVAPITGFDAISPIMAESPKGAIILENWFPQPDCLISRQGYVDHSTGFADPVRRMHVHAATNGGESLWATTDAGIYDATVAGPIGATVMALTNGYTISTVIATGAGNYLMLVNGTDTLKQYDGTTWSSVATFGGTATSVYSYIETYRQRLFLVKKNSLEIEYLAPNAIAGAATNYPLGAIFRQGGFIVAVGTWTVDGGTGPEDQLAVVTNKGEVAVFSGSDPSTWDFRGVYFVGRPLDDMCLYKYGGDLLFLTENGVYPLSSVLQSSVVDRAQSVTNRIRPVFSAAAASFANNRGWQIISNPLIPFILINIPSTPVVKQAIMHSQTGAWTMYSGWNANCFARMGSELYFGGAESVARVNGVSDNGGNITCTMLQNNSRFGYPRDKMVTHIKPYFTANGGYRYNLGIAPNFVEYAETTEIIPIEDGTAAIWGSGLWGTAEWTGTTAIIEDWQAVPDIFSQWKALYCQVVTNDGIVKYLGSEIRHIPGGDY